MENKKKELIKWALHHFGTRLKIFEQRWNLFEQQPYYDYRVEIQLDSYQSYGRGTSSSQDQSLCSAIGEALERLAIKINQLNSSNGIALYSNPEIAKSRASLELLERHNIMLYSLGHIPNKEISLGESESKILSIVTKLKSINIDYNFFQLESGPPYTILAQASGINYQTPFGLCFGASSSFLLGDALEKSFLESLVNVVAHMNNTLSSINENQFRKIFSPGPEDHLSLYSNVKFAKDYLEKSRHQESNIQPLDMKLVSFSEIQYPYSSLFPVFKASHPKALDIQWGYLSKSYMGIENLNYHFPMVLP